MLVEDEARDFLKSFMDLSPTYELLLVNETDAKLVYRGVGDKAFFVLLPSVILPVAITFVLAPVSFAFAMLVVGLLFLLLGTLIIKSVPDSRDVIELSRSGYLVPWNDQAKIPLSNPTFSVEPFWTGGTQSYRKYALVAQSDSGSNLLAACANYKMLEKLRNELILFWSG